MLAAAKYFRSGVALVVSFFEHKSVRIIVLLIEIYVFLFLFSVVYIKVTNTPIPYELGVLFMEENTSVVDTLGKTTAVTVILGAAAKVASTCATPVGKVGTFAATSILGLGTAYGVNVIVDTSYVKTPSIPGRLPNPTLGDSSATPLSLMPSDPNYSFWDVVFSGLPA